MEIHARDKFYVLALVLLAALVAVDWDSFTFLFALWLLVDIFLLAVFRLTQLAFQLRRRVSRSAAWLSWVNIWIIFPLLVGWTVFGTVLFVLDRDDVSLAFALWLVYNWATCVGFLIVMVVLSRHMNRGAGMAQFRSPAAIQEAIDVWRQQLEYGIEPATRGLTQDEIERLPLRQATADEDRTCSICLSDARVGELVRTLACKHVFHAECLDQWLLMRDTCPNCVQRVSPDEHTGLLV